MSSVERWVLSHWTTREVLAQPLSGLQIMSLRHLHEHESGLCDNVPEPANTQKTIWPWPSWLSFTFSAHRAHLPLCHRVQRHQWFSVSRLHRNFLACPHSHLFHYLLLLWKQHCGYWRKCAWWHSKDKWHFWPSPLQSLKPSRTCKQLLSSHRIPEGREHMDWGSICFQGSDATSGQPLHGTSYKQVSWWMQYHIGDSGAQK